ncbi:MAG: putative cytochrome c [Acidobacteria bacterium]|nr:putative cytochrome c [Acidobacteriota bacterium]
MDLPDVPSGKLGSINDFRIYPDINWIGKLVNVDGVTVDGGCSKCHAGLGLKSAAIADRTQLENEPQRALRSRRYSGHE